jgi:hypothetical protein
LIHYFHHNLLILLRLLANLAALKGSRVAKMTPAKELPNVKKKAVLYLLKMRLEGNV